MKTEDIVKRSFDTFDKGWALVTAGTARDFNTMTISWGGLGTLWNKPVATVYIRPCRYTYGYMEKSDYFTVSFFDGEYRKDLALLGTLSGRDGDKVAKTRLTAKKIGDSVGFRQRKITLLCKKIYREDFKLDKIPDFAKSAYYTEEAPHKMYIGEVVEVIE